MGAIKVPTNFNIELEFEIPEFYRRLLALLIDGLIIFCYIKIAEWLFDSMVKNSDFSSDSLHDLFGWKLIFQVPFLIYFPLQEITMNGQSVGKKIMSLRVVNENGGRASISQFMIRWLIRDVWFLFLFWYAIEFKNNESIFLVILIISYFITEIILVVTSQKGQRLGDILAHTIIISTNSRNNIEETVFEEVADNYVPSYPQIMQLSDKDINAIKSILETARKKGDFNMASIASEKIKAHLGIEADLSPFDFLAILLKDYNYLSTKQ